MLPMLLVSIVAVAVVMVLLVLSTRWAMQYVLDYIAIRQRAAQCIVEEGRVPEEWARPYRRRLDSLQRKGGSPAEAERIGQRAQARFLRQLDDLTRYFERARCFDTEETRRLVLRSLEERRDQWAAAAWQDLLGHPAPAA